MTTVGRLIWRQYNNLLGAAQLTADTRGKLVLAVTTAHSATEVSREDLMDLRDGITKYLADTKHAAATTRQRPRRHSTRKR